MEFYTRYNPGKSPHIRFTMPSMTEQYHRDEVDINTIIAKYQRTGVLGTPTQVRETFFGDFTNVDTKFEAALALKDAEHRFMDLPSNVRAAFDHDALKFMKALNDDSQISKLVSLGIYKAPAPEVGTQLNPGDVSSVKPTEQPATKE